MREEQNTATRDKKPAKVHVYAGICARGKTNLHFVTGTDGQSPPAELNYKGKGAGGGEYRLLLEKHLVPEAQALFKDIPNEWWYMQDGASPHTAKLTKKLLDKLCPHWITDWPANSPDLNPIENGWKIVKDKLRGRSFNTIEQFKSAVVQAWESISVYQIKKANS